MAFTALDSPLCLSLNVLPMEKFQILGRSRGGILSPGLHLHLFLEFAAKASDQSVNKSLEIEVVMVMVMV